MRGFSSLQGSSLVIYIFLESHLVHGDRRFVFYKVAPRSLLEFLRIPPRLGGACGLSRQHGLTFSVFFPCLPVLPGFCLLRTVFCSVWGPLLPGARCIGLLVGVSRRPPGTGALATNQRRRRALETVPAQLRSDGQREPSQERLQQSGPTALTWPVLSTQGSVAPAWALVG